MILKYTEWVGMDEILALVDAKYGYAEDPLIVNLMNECEVSREYRHLVDRRAMLRYIHYYEHEHKISITKNNHTNKGYKYLKSDIDKILSDPETEKRLESQIEKRTIKYGVDNLLIPKCIYNEFLKTISPMDLQALKNTGYSDNQIKLLNMSEADLEKTKSKLIKRIQKLNYELELAKIELDDVENEFKHRRFPRIH